MAAFRLLVEAGPQPGQCFDLMGSKLVAGRDPGCDIVIAAGGVSRRHVELTITADAVLIEDLHSSNGTWLNGQKIQGRQSIRPGEVIGLGQTVRLRLERLEPPPTPGVAGEHTLVLEPSGPPAPEAAATRIAGPEDFPDVQPPGLEVTIERGEPQIYPLTQARFSLGRAVDNDIVLPSPLVSRRHARLERVGGRLRLVDLQSANGTFLNHQRIHAEAWVRPGDMLGIGPHRLLLGEKALARQDRPGGMQVLAQGLNKRVRKDLNLLNDISLVFQPGEFIAIVGQSGGGKTTLQDAIAGYRPASDGQVLLNGIDAYRSFDAVRGEIGYVPQRDIIHTELAVNMALDYAAQLRMPPDTTPEERQRRVTQVLADLDLLHRKDVQISRLSGGQQKRVSIGVELLTSPRLFFLDEPTSGLDPGTETALMQLLRRLADGGRTIVLVTHATKNILLADKVVFLARGGHLAWFGPPAEALTYFQAQRQMVAGQNPPLEFDEIFTLLDDPVLGQAEDWGRRYRASPAYGQYIAAPLERSGRVERASGRMSVGTARPSRRWKRPAWGAALRQFAILSSRNLKILTRDRFSLALMLAVAPLVGLLDVIISRLLGRNLFAYETGSLINVTTSLFLLSVYGVLVGGLAFMREFVKEADIYRRERLVNLQILPYVLSKVWVVLLLALYHAAAYLFMHYLAFTMPGGALEFAQLYLSLVLASMGGMLLGLFASALAPNANAAPLITILFMLPQIVLAGALINVPSYVSAPTSTRWAYEAFLIITGPGSDVAADPCWGLPGNLRAAMTVEEKDAFGCRCLGSRVLDPGSCTFPGLGGLAVPALQQPLPEPLDPLPAPPANPLLPEPPEKPADLNDSVALAEFLSQLEAYQQQAEAIQADYQNRVAAYQSEAEQYAREKFAYEQSLMQRQLAYIALISQAEGLIASGYDAHGWAFVDRAETAWYWRRLFNTWRSQLVLMGVLLAAILVLMQLKDRVR